jgi:uncharacterized SAM-binding protein YcdF (DUF218 family)
MSENSSPISRVVDSAKDSEASPPISHVVDDAKQCVWDYMLMGHELKAASAIIALGSFDTNIAVYAAQLYLEGWAPLLVCSGSGTVNQTNPAWGDFIGSTEAEIFADIAIKLGVPADAILIENQSQNTGQNYEFTTALLKERGIDVTGGGATCIVVQKQFMERRTYATGKVWWPNVNIIVKSPPMTCKDYPASNPAVNVGEHWVHAMVGDLQRIALYPAKGFQIPQEIPEGVWAAFEILVAAGYNKCLLAA